MHSIHMHHKVMNIPSTWKATKHMVSLKTSEEESPVRNVRRRTLMNPSSTESYLVNEDIIQIVRNELNNKHSFPINTETLNLQTILSGISYKQIIEEVYTKNDSKNRDVPLVTKTYEESFMRECINSNEKPCAMMNNCECMKIDEGNQFIGTQFLLPGEIADSEPRMCILCHRQLTQKLFFDLMYNGMTFQFPIQKYGNICGTPGEYSNEVMLFCPTNGPLHCMPYPSASHQRNRYSVYINYGTRYLKQHRMAFEELKDDTVRFFLYIFFFV